MKRITPKNYFCFCFFLGSFLFNQWACSTSTPLELEILYKQKIVEMSESLKNKLLDHSILDALRKNKKEKSEYKKVLIVDRLWQKGHHDDQIVKPVLENPCSLHIKKITEELSYVAEIIITNNIGENVCISQKTSDYYQADEMWWKKSFSSEKFYQDKAKYDKSAHLYAKTIGFNLKDPSTGNTIGVVKAVLDDFAMSEKIKDQTNSQENLASQLHH